MPSTRTTRTKRIPSNPKRTNNKPKLLPVINSYCLQDESKCDWSLSRNSNYGVSLLLLWQVLELLGNIEKEQHRWLQCSAFLGFLLKTQKSTASLKLCPQGKITWSGIPRAPRLQQLSPGGQLSLAMEFIRGFNVRTSLTGSGRMCQWSVSSKRVNSPEPGCRYHTKSVSETLLQAAAGKAT